MSISVNHSGRAAGCVCQHINMTSASVHHGNVAYLKRYVYHSYYWTFTTTKILVAIQTWQQQLCSLPPEREQRGQTLLSFWLLFWWTRRRCCWRDFWIFGAMLYASCPNHKQSDHMFFIAPLACYSLHSWGEQHSESTGSNCCWTSRRTHHCRARCLEIWMLLCGFFMSPGQYLPHQMYLYFVALSQPVRYSQCNLFSTSDKSGGPQR